LGIYGDCGDFLMENMALIKLAEMTNQFPPGILNSSTVEGDSTS
jgi:hypothetical protein